MQKVSLSRDHWHGHESSSCRLTIICSGSLPICVGVLQLSKYYGIPSLPHEVHCQSLNDCTVWLAALLFFLSSKRLLRCHDIADHTIHLIDRGSGLVVHAAEDYYTTLGVDKGADKKTIKSAYRQKARKFHPDVNKAADAEDKFKSISNAYEVLSDDQKRGVYDRCEPSVFATPAFQSVRTVRVLTIFCTSHLVVA